MNLVVAVFMSVTFDRHGNRGGTSSRDWWTGAGDSERHYFFEMICVGIYVSRYFSKSLIFPCSPPPIHLSINNMNIYRVTDLISFKQLILNTFSNNVIINRDRSYYINRKPGKKAFHRNNLASTIDIQTQYLSWPLLSRHSSFSTRKILNILLNINISFKIRFHQSKIH